METLFHFCQMFIILLPPVPPTDIHSPSAAVVALPAETQAAAPPRDVDRAREAVDPETMREAMKIREQLGIRVLEGSSLDDVVDRPPAEPDRHTAGPIDYRQIAYRSLLQRLEGIIVDLDALQKHDEANRVRELERELRREFGRSDH